MERRETPTLYLTVTQVVLIEGEPTGVAEGLGADGITTVYRDDAHVLEAIAARLEAGEPVVADVPADRVMARSWPAGASPGLAPAAAMIAAAGAATPGRAPRPRQNRWRWSHWLRPGQVRALSRLR